MVFFKIEATAPPMNNEPSQSLRGKVYSLSEELRDLSIQTNDFAESLDDSHGNY